MNLHGRLRRSALATSLLWLLAACPAGDDGSAGTSTGGASMPSSGAATMGASSTAPDDTGMDGSADGTSDTTPPPTTAGSGSGGDGGGGPQCDPAADDDECAACVKTNCCDQLEACAMDVDCTCFQDCVEMNPGPQGAIACGGDCDVMLFGEGTTAELVMCSSARPCGPLCGV